MPAAPTRPIGSAMTPPFAGEAEYAVGGSVSTRVAARSGTKLRRRSLAFACRPRAHEILHRAVDGVPKALWERSAVSENLLVCEDLCSIEARRQARTAFVARESALRPRNTFSSACQQTARYAMGDGQVGVRWGRLLRNAARCVFEMRRSPACVELRSAAREFRARVVVRLSPRWWHLPFWRQGEPGPVCLFRCRAMGGGREPGPRLFSKKQLTNPQNAPITR